MTQGMLEHFVNRKIEMDLIEKNYSTLLVSNRPIRQQFIQFYGVGGIGKTTILRKIQHEYTQKNLSPDQRTLYPIWADASHEPAFITEDIIKQVQNFGIALSTQLQGDEIDKSVEATRAILRHGPVVFLIDALDYENEEHFSWIEKLLHRLTEDSKLFFVLASKKIISFERTMAIARKLKTFLLEPFTRKHCLTYISLLAPESTEATQNLIYKWTGGYPLAVNMMIQTIEAEHLNLSKDLDQRRILNVITENVINRGVLANVVQDEAELHWYQTTLGLFSIPRYLNLSLMQKMIEKFADQYKLSSSLGYIDMPRRLNKKADVLVWKQSKAGFSMEAPIRPIFLTKLHIEEPQKYHSIHKYLADFNESLVQEVTGTDKIRCLLEFLYHTACGASDTTMMQIAIEKTMQTVLSEPLDSLALFQEEYERDEELKEELGLQKNLPLSLLNKYFAEGYWQEAENATSTEKRVEHLQLFFSHVLRGPFVESEPAEFLIKQSTERVVKLYGSDKILRGLLHEELINKREIQSLFGPQYPIFLSSLIEDEASDEKRSNADADPTN